MLKCFRQDRAFRKYLRISSIPGIFINFEEDNPGACLNQAVHQNKNLINATKSEAIAHIRKIHEFNTTDKNNQSKDSPKKLNGSLNGFTGNVSSECKELLMCSANPADCIVHSTSVKRCLWSFIHDQHQIDELISSLNKRGIRESELQQVVKNDYESLIDIVLQTPVTQLNPKVQVEETTEQRMLKVKKSGKSKYNDANLGFPTEMDVTEVLHTTLIDYILEMEEKIHAGNLGNLRTKDRNKWRECLLNKRYRELDTTIIKQEKGKTLKFKVEGNLFLCISQG